MTMLNWGKLVSQGRAKAQGVSWSDEEMKAIALFCETFKKTMSDVAPYIRKGILTVEGFKKAQDKSGVINPFLKLPQKELLKKAIALKISVSPDATKEVLAQAILEEKQKQTAATKAKAEAEAKVKAEAEKNEKEAKKKATPKPKAEAKKK